MSEETIQAKTWQDTYTELRQEMENYTPYQLLGLIELAQLRVTIAAQLLHTKTVTNE